MTSKNISLFGAGRVAIVGFSVALLLAPSAVVLGASKDSSKQAEKFRQQGENARKAIERARDQLQTTVATYDAMLGADDKKLTGAHKKLTAEIGKMDKAVEDGTKQIESFQNTAEEFFTLWETQLDEIQTESIKSASEKRLQAARAIFKNMGENLNAAGESYRPLIASLHEQSTLVGQDMSTETLAILGKDAAPDIHARAEAVYASIEKSLSKEAASESEMDTVLDEEETAVAEDEGDDTGGTVETADADPEDGTD